MKKFLFVLLTISFVLLFATSLSAGKLDGRGKAWLDAQTDAPAMSVDGTWNSDAFNDIHLVQAAGSRDVTGVGGGYNLTGVVSGKRLYLLFASGHTVEYCAVLNAGSDGSLMGSYSDRVTRLRLGAGLCQGYSRPMFMTKK
jgi:hypothetical protein